MKKRFKSLLFGLAFAFSVICIFSSCSQILGGSDSSDASVSFSFRLNHASSFRSAVLPEDDSSAKTYRVVASLLCRDNKSIEKKMNGGEEIAFSFENVHVGEKAKVHVMIYVDDELVYAGSSSEFTVQSGENTAEIVLREILSLYVSAEGNQENSGTSAKSSVKTLNKAFNRISEYTEEYGLSDIDWTIHVIGKVFSTSKMQNLTAGSITVVGDGDGAILDGRKENPEEGESGTVFAIDESIEFPVFVRNLTIQNGSAKNGGGMNIRSNSTTRIENCIIQNNETKPVEIDGTMQSASGGGIYFAGKNLELVNTTVQKNSTSTWVSMETKSDGKTQPANNGGNGGGICTGAKDFHVITMYEGCVIRNNTAENNAGGVCMNGGTFYMKGGEISGNTAMNNSGGFYLNHGKFYMEGGKISGNKASSYKITVTNADGTTEEKTTGGSGGGMYINRGTFIFTGGEISANEAAATGGGIFQNGKPEDGEEGVSRIEIRGGKIYANNSVGGQAGGVYVRKSNSSLFLYSGEISGNTSATQGGGVYVDEGSFTMSGGEISKNTANTQGGGVYVNRRDTTCGTFTMTGGKITENWANSSTKGGGIFNRGKLALSGKITIAENMTGDESYSTPAQVFVLKDAVSATLEYKGTLLCFNFNSEKNALLTANLVDGEFSETDESIFKSAFIESLADFMNREFSVFANNGIYLYLQKKDDSGNKTYEKAISSVAELAEVSNSSSGYAQGTDPFVATESGEAGTFTFENVSLYLDSVGRFRIGFDTSSEKSKYLLLNATSHKTLSKTEVSMDSEIPVGEEASGQWNSYVKVSVESTGTLSVLVSNLNKEAESTRIAIINPNGVVVAVEDVDNTMAKNTDDKILKAEVSEGDYYIANFWERNSEDKLVGGAVIKQILFAGE